MCCNHVGFVYKVVLGVVLPVLHTGNISERDPVKRYTCICNYVNHYILYFLLVRVKGEQNQKGMTVQLQLQIM